MGDSRREVTESAMNLLSVPSLNEPGGPKFVRLDVEEDLQSVQLDDWEKLGKVRADTAKYLTTVEQEIELVVGGNVWDTIPLSVFVHRIGSNSTPVSLSQGPRDKAWILPSPLQINAHSGRA